MFTEDLDAEGDEGLDKESAKGKRFTSDVNSKMCTL